MSDERSRILANGTTFSPGDCALAGLCACGVRRRIFQHDTRARPVVDWCQSVLASVTVSGVSSLVGLRPLVRSMSMTRR